MVTVSKKRIKKLESIFAKFPEILSEFGIKGQILKTFKFEKPLTSIEVDSVGSEKVLQFMKEIEDFFFVGNKIILTGKERPVNHWTDQIASGLQNVEVFYYKSPRCPICGVVIPPNVYSCLNCNYAKKL